MAQMAPWEEAAQGQMLPPGPAPSKSAMPWEEAAAAAPTTSNTGRMAPGTSVGGMRPTSLFDQVTNPVRGRTTDSLTRKASDFVQNIGTSGLHLITHPQDILSGIGSMNPAEWVAEDAATGNNPIKEQYQQANTDPAGTLASAIGTAAVTGAAPEVMHGTGAALRELGGKVGGMTLGSNALDRQFGAKPGRGISETGTVAMTRPSLAAKVNAKIPQLVEARNAILDKNKTPVDISGAVSQPFDDIRSRVANPRTGVAAPSEIADLGNTQAAAVIQQNPLTGKPLMDYTTNQPKWRNLTDLTPSEIAEYNSNLRGMADYTANDSPLANQALKMAGHNLRTKMLEAAPEATDASKTVHNTEAASDILNRQMTEGSRWNPTSETLMGALMRRVGDPALVTGGSLVANALGGAGKLLQGGAGLLRPGGNVQPSGTATTAITPGHGPTPTGSPVNPASYAPPTLSPGFIPNPAGIPETAGPTIATPTAKAPPNVSLTERVGASALPPRPGNPAPVPGAGGVEGPLTKVVTRPRNKFGPRVDANAFTIPKKQLPSGGK